MYACKMKELPLNSGNTQGKKHTSTLPCLTCAESCKHLGPVILYCPPQGLGRSVMDVSGTTSRSSNVPMRRLCRLCGQLCRDLWVPSPSLYMLACAREGRWSQSLFMPHSLPETSGVYGEMGVERCGRCDECCDSGQVIIPTPEKYPRASWQQATQLLHSGRYACLLLLQR